MNQVVGWITNIVVELAILGNDKEREIWADDQDASVPGEGSSHGKLQGLVLMRLDVKERNKVAKYNYAAS